MQVSEVIGRALEVSARCAFTVHQRGPEGPEVRDVTLEQQLFYRVRCEPQKGHCLRVCNCTVSETQRGNGTKDGERWGGGRTHLVIDERGCATEASLFQHVMYEDDFTAGIFNPYPIRFRSSRSTGVQLQCATSLILLEKDGQCPRESCDTKGNSAAEERKNG
ncbi:hypothetical protein niasHS_002457 [Heterodera schachtii]|uniref:ZP domain-containing protein n=1 Tax=Heterodera schachtii TaxID=97005 RepID=A0ABD2KK90_HETSC